MSKTQSVNLTKSEVLEQFPDPRRNTRQVIGHLDRHRDSDSIRRYYGIPAWDRSDYDFQNVIPNLLVHTWDAGEDMDAGGTDLLATGKPGKGKSTQALHFATRLMDINHETVVWRGSPSRSEWLPLAPWTKLCLPRGVDYRVLLEPRDPTQERVEISVDELERIVREVVRYRDPIHLNQELLDREHPQHGGQFAVVYPDPEMRRCQEIYDESVYRKDGLEFDPSHPPKHWWFAWALARVYHGPHHWMTWICDEVGDIAPQNARKDELSTFQKVELLKDLWVDARKHGLSIFAWGHSEVDVHQMIRHKMRWRIQMPGRANPISKSDVVGFGSVPMNHDLTSSAGIGRGLLYTEENFAQFGWPDYPSPSSFKIKIRREA